MANEAPLHAQVIIVGSGPAGYTAAIYAARAMMEPVLIAGFEPGGQLMITTEVENYPGFALPIQGPWLMEQLKAQAEHVGTRLVADHIEKVELGRRPFLLIGDSGRTYACDALVIATGAKAKWLGIPSEERFKGYGASACATCDGFFFRGKEVLVVGGGNSAVEEALYLSHICSRVTLVHRRDAFRAERILQERLFARPNVEIVWNHTVEEILGDDLPAPTVRAVRLRNVHTRTHETRQVDGVFVAIGHHPASDLFIGQVDCKPNGYIKTVPGSTVTSVPGVFAAGDVADDIYRQAVTAAGLGCMAALEAEKWLTLEAVTKMAAE
jgi:thioredoxin reductase (NADPH)